MAVADRTFTVIDRNTNEVRDTGLTSAQVVDQHIERESSSAMSLMRHMRIGQQISLGPNVIVRRTS